MEHFLERGLTIREEHIDPLATQPLSTQFAREPVCNGPQLHADTFSQVLQAHRMYARHDEEMPRGYRLQIHAACQVEEHGLVNIYRLPNPPPVPICRLPKT